MQCFSMICVSAASKSNLAKAAGAEVAVERRHEKLHACSEKHIFKSKSTKHTRFGPLFEVAMWKNCTPL